MLFQYSKIFCESAEVFRRPTLDVLQLFLGLRGSCLHYLGRACRIRFMMPSSLSWSWKLSSLFFKLCGEFDRLEDAPFGDDAGDQLSRRHVEGWIVDCDSGWRDRVAAVDGSDF